MASQQEHISTLWQLYLTDQASPEQMGVLFAYLKEQDNEAVIDEAFQQAMQASGLEKSFAPHPEGNAASFTSLLAARESLRQAWENKVGSIPPVEHVHHDSRPSMPYLRQWGWAAASVLLVLGIGAYLWTNNKSRTPPPAVAQQTMDIAPGREGAVLTLADGSQVVLDSLGNGLVAAQHGSQVLLQDGKLAYDPTGASSGETVYNTMSTPNGRQFQVALPDGTQVWLNAASSIRYPTVFTGKERKVTVRGEAYFEVAKNTQQPFFVSVDDKATIAVLGTHFNVNAYDNEASIQATLLEGSIAVSIGLNGQGITGRPASAGDEKVILQPGQQAEIGRETLQEQGGSPTPATIQVTTVASDKVIAWKQGLFNFEGVGVGALMRQIARWYNVEVVYAGAIPQAKFAGAVKRNTSLKDLLASLQQMGVKNQLSANGIITVFP